MNSIRLFNKSKVAFCLAHLRFYAINSNFHNGFRTCAGRKINSPLLLNISNKHVKHISNCNLMLTKDSDYPSKEDNEKFEKVVDDKEFQNILQDFAKDFDVDSDSKKVLEDIRKNIDGCHVESDLPAEKHDTNTTMSVATVDGRFQFKYKDFSDSDSTVIHSYEEQYDPFEESEKTYHVDQELKPKVSYTDLKRGISGVYDLDELVDILRNENLLDVTSITIPKELHYADFLVLATAKSSRHSEAVTELINKLYKQKKSKKDQFIKVEGEKVGNWKVLDMGNIVLHIFLEETRALYDLESLWLFDSNFDSGGNLQTDPMMNILQEQMEFFNSLQQSQSKSPKEPESKKEPYSLT